MVILYGLENTFTNMEDKFFDDMDIFIKDNLDLIIVGEFNDKFTKEQLDKMLELSFLYNHITISNDTLTFNYNECEINVKNIFSQYSDLVYTSKRGVNNIIINTIISQDGFKSSFKSFLREKQIDRIMD